MTDQPPTTVSKRTALSTARAREMLLRHLNDVQRADLEETGCFNFRVKKGAANVGSCSCEVCLASTKPGRLLRISTLDIFPPAIDAYGHCKNAWPEGIFTDGRHLRPESLANSGVERALGIVLALEARPELFDHCVCESRYTTDHMLRRGQPYPRADDYEGRL